MSLQETVPIKKYDTFRLENKRSIKLIGGGGGGGGGGAWFYPGRNLKLWVMLAPDATDYQQSSCI